MAISIYEVPQRLICGACGTDMPALKLVKPKRGLIAVHCPNGSCKQYGQTYFFRFTETMLHEKVPPEDLV